MAFLYYRQLASAGATFTMTLAHAVVEGASAIGDTSIPWTTIKRTIRDKEHLFLPISKREALILPRRGFASDAEFDAACDYAAARVEATRGQ